MIVPHRIVDEGRAIVFEPGPLEFQDFTDTIWHARRTHDRGRQRPLREAWVTQQQGYTLRHAEQFRYGTGTTDPLILPERAIGRIWGMDVFILDPYTAPRGRRPAEYLHPEMLQRLTDRPPVVMHVTAGTNPTTETWATVRNQMDRYIFDGIKGMKIDGVWLDEPKKVETTHEIW